MEVLTDVSNADKLLMICAVQAGCRQLSELSFFSLLPWRVIPPKSSANRQDLACPVCHRKMNVFLGWPEGQRVCSGLAAFSSAVSSPVLCLPSGLLIQSSWKDLLWQPCILWVTCGITHLATGLTLLQKEGEYRTALQLLRR